ncbi:MAG: hypothetical protein AB4063_05920 [Crocosphaera sp.]
MKGASQHLDYSEQFCSANPDGIARLYHLYSEPLFLLGLRFLEKSFVNFFN